MKQNKGMAEAEKRWKKDMEIFFVLCGEEDRKFFLYPEKAASTDEYVRLFTIAAVFAFRGPMFRTIKQAEALNLDDRVFCRLKEIGRDYSRISGWMEDFIDKIEDEEMKRTAKEFWSERRRAFEKSGCTDIGKLFL